MLIAKNIYTSNNLILTRFYYSDKKNLNQEFFIKEKFFIFDCIFNITPLGFLINFETILINYY